MLAWTPNEVSSKVALQLLSFAAVSLCSRCMFSHHLFQCPMLFLLNLSPRILANPRIATQDGQLQRHSYCTLPPLLPPSHMSTIVITFDVSTVAMPFQTPRYYLTSRSPTISSGSSISDFMVPGFCIQSFSWPCC